MNNRKQYTTDLQDKEWMILEEFLARVLDKHKTRGRPLAQSLREIINAIRYLLRNGNSWRNLPADFPPLAHGLLSLCQVAPKRPMAQAEQALETCIA